MVTNIALTFCTYFKNIQRFVYEQETYEECVAFCVKQGSFSYRIGEEKADVVSQGEIVICPPNQPFYREIIQPSEVCMIKFKAAEGELFLGKKIRVTNLLRYNEDLSRLEGCLFCDRLFDEPIFSHYCMDVLYLAIDSVGENSKIAVAKSYLEQNFDKEIFIGELAGQMGYSTPHLINKFKAYYGITPKAFVSQVRILKAKELLLSTDKLSREIAYSLGFTDELYFIRFFKKDTGLTPKQFREYRL
ncbi:MAG: helix-turn-helix transcriptional regulator [Clostridia bacterium]|nr:helix-turn-helix transcriptional regulator [Clostridia bacterium]